MKNLNHRLYVFALFFVFTITACSPPANEQAQNAVPQPTPKEASVKRSKIAYAMPERHAGQAVEKVLLDGGNAIDAAVTAAFTLAVTHSVAGNLGGGGFLLTRMDGNTHFLDYREKAPVAAFRDMYLDDKGEVIKADSLIGIRAAGVPGTVYGFWQAHQKFGTKPWSELIAPAIALARDGFEVHPKRAAGIPEMAEWFGDEINFMQYFGIVESGGIFKQPELADTLTRIAEQGPNDFYHGESARLLVSQMERDGGLITAQDLADYQSVWRAPLVAPWRDYTVVSAPPPSSGGFAVVHLLKMKEFLQDKFSGHEHNSPQYIHLVAEMEKRVFADRAVYFGDPDFIDIPMDNLMDEEYIRRRAAEVQQEKISTSEQAIPGLDSPDTTHFSIIDRWGNAVSNTYSINYIYGSGVVVEGAGFLLNNTMDDFSSKAGVTNIYGVVGDKANEVQPNRRPLSSMSPTILLKDEKVDMVLGSPGGSTIFTSVFQAVVNVVAFDMTPLEAVSASRFHHQLVEPDLITESVTVPLPEETKAELRKRGYRVEPHPFEFGDLQFIARYQGELRAASDPRGIGVAKVMDVE
jgi:gamma-glutamyltranspeptidase/glutathione hydrolase